MELKHEQLVYEKQAGCFFRRVVQDDRKRVLNCVILSLKYGKYKWTLKYKFKKKRSKIYEGTGKIDQLCDGVDPEQ